MGTTFLAALLTLPGSFAGGADDPERLPPPAQEIFLPVALYRPDPRAVWQWHAVDQRGVFRPAVRLDPYPHYAASGKPYYGMPVRTSP
ncbi:MAG: hypothetical protein ACJ8F7_16360 [Gemmataceae bacterium]